MDGSTPAISLRSTDDGERLNLILISLDTLRSDHLSVYGYPKPTTPFLEELAATGVVFESMTAITADEIVRLARALGSSS